MTRLSTIMLFLAFAGEAAAQEKVEIKFAKPKVGDSAKIVESREEVNDVLAIVGENENKINVKKKGKFTYVRTILEVKDGKPVKMTRKYEAAEVTLNGEAVTPSFAGKTVMIDMTGEETTYTVDGKPVPKSDVEWIESDSKKRKKEFEDAIQPGKPVAVGDTWKFDASEIFGDDKMKYDEAKSVTTCKLLKVHNKDGKQYGTIEITMDLVVIAIDMGGAMADTKEGSSMKAKGTIDCCIDGSVQAGTLAMKLEMGVTAKIPQGGSVNVKASLDGTKMIAPVAK